MREGRIVAARSADPAPPSAVSGWTGLAGLVPLLAWTALSLGYQIDGPYAALVALLCVALPVTGWSLLAERVHRRPSTGLGAARRPWAEVRRTSAVKLTALWATWAMIAAFYALGRWYWDGAWLFAMHVLMAAAGPLALLSIPYVAWVDRRMAAPHDELHAFGAAILGLAPFARPAVAKHARTWAVKGFFLAFMLSIVPGNWANVIDTDRAKILSDPARLADWLIDAMFMLDVSFATIGYLLTMRPLDAHIRSADPHAAGWAAALICYPPFILMNEGGPLDYHQGTGDWTDWLGGSPVALWAVGTALVALTGIYAWATIAFGPRFSNLTDRGIITNGPYRWSKHPAYLSKNLFWWLSSLPFLATTGLWSDAIRNTAVLGAVSGVYYWRARTEERHLGADPAYRAYADWMARHAAVPRMLGWASRALFHTANPQVPVRPE